MRRAILKRLTDNCQRWADKELDARQASRHELEDIFMRQRLTVATCIDEAHAVIMEDKGWQAIVGVSQTQEPNSGARTTAPATPDSPNSTRFMRIGNEIWERDGLSEKRVCTCEGSGRAVAVLEALRETYDVQP
jgi:hypothetical protein